MTTRTQRGLARAWSFALIAVAGMYFAESLTDPDKGDRIIDRIMFCVVLAIAGNLWQMAEERER